MLILMRGYNCSNVYYCPIYAIQCNFLPNGKLVEDDTRCLYTSALKLYQVMIED